MPDTGEACCWLGSGRGRLRSAAASRDALTCSSLGPGREWLRTSSQEEAWSRAERLRPIAGCDALPLGDRPEKPEAPEALVLVPEALLLARGGMAQGRGRSRPSAGVAGWGAGGLSTSRVWVGVLPWMGSNFSPPCLPARRRATPPTAMTRVVLPARAERESSKGFGGRADGADGFLTLGDGTVGMVGSRSCSRCFGVAWEGSGGSLVGPWQDCCRRVKYSTGSRDSERRRIAARDPQACSFRRPIAAIR